MPLHIRCGKNRCIHATRPAFITGSTNTTPDSFYHASSSLQGRKNLNRTLNFKKAAADIIGTKGEATRSDSSYAHTKKKLKRIHPLIQIIHKTTNMPISADTRKELIGRKSCQIGFNICNTISALSANTELTSRIAKKDGSVIRIHKHGLPLSMQQHPECSGDTIGDVCSYRIEPAQSAQSCDIEKEHIMINCSIGFSKIAEEHERLVAASAGFSSLEHPLVVGVSRKPCIGKLNNKEFQHQQSNRIATESCTVQQGVAIFWAHDVPKKQNMLPAPGEI